MRAMTVDLASKFSAVCVRDRGGKVLCEFDSAGMTAFGFAAKVARMAIELEVDLVMIEDVPYGISSQAMTKPVLRLQGVLFTMLNKIQDRVLFLNPSTWQNAYEGVARAPKEIPKNKRDDYRKEAARVHAERLGYTPPDLVAAHVAQCELSGTKVLKKHTNPLEKSMTDYIDAFLMTDWIFSFETIEQIKAKSGVQPFLI